jgi:hypothetical protein
VSDFTLYLRLGHASGPVGSKPLPMVGVRAIERGDPPAFCMHALDAEPLLRRLHESVGHRLVITDRGCQFDTGLAPPQGPGAAAARIASMFHQHVLDEKK